MLKVSTCKYKTCIWGDTFGCLMDYDHFPKICQKCKRLLKIVEIIACECYFPSNCSCVKLPICENCKAVAIPLKGEDFCHLVRKTHDLIQKHNAKPFKYLIR